jgi:arsenical pump membrane protein
VMWSIVPLVAGLFVIVAALDRAGALDLARRFVAEASVLPAPAGALLTSFAVTVLANVANNLPVALAAGLAVHSEHVSRTITRATLVAVDLGPNLSVTGSLATLLWLAALRREGIALGPREFLRVGSMVLLPALVLAELTVR